LFYIALGQTIPVRPFKFRKTIQAANKIMPQNSSFYSISAGMAKIGKSV
jgi:hypothetical protein